MLELRCTQAQKSLRTSFITKNAIFGHWEWSFMNFVALKIRLREQA
jgi:hypothetical protein